jgi:rSAM/selenodomain-associated transferase 1
MRSIRILIFAKAPRPGEAKTRLIPALGAEGAARLARRMLAHAIEQAVLANVGTVELCRTPADESAWRDFPLPADILQSTQGEGSLGERLARATERVIGAGSAALLIGTDCPELDASVLRQLAASLESAQAAMVPAADGGYVALALDRHHPRLFTGIDWSTSSVARDTLHRLAELGWSTRELPVLHDIDEPSDLRWLPAEWPEAAVAGRPAFLPPRAG